MAPLHAARRLILAGLPAPLVACAVAALAIWAALPACAAEGTAGHDLSTEPGLRRVLDGLEAPYEGACRELGAARWSLLQAPSPPAIQRYLKARQRIGEVYASDELSRVLETWAARNTVTSDPTLLRRVRLWEESRIGVEIETSPAVFALASDLTARMIEHRYPWDGGLSGGEALDQVIATDPDTARRRAAYSARLTLAASVARDMRRLIRTRGLSARKTRSLFFHHVVMEANDLRPEWLYKVLQILSRRTDPAYKSLVASLGEAAGASALAPWDIDFGMNRLSALRKADEIDRKYFPASGVVASMEGLLDDLGFDRDKLHLTFVTSDSHRGAAGVALSIPDDYRILVGTEMGGADLYEQTLREVGFALLALLNARPAPMLKGYDCAPGTRNGPYAEAMAEAFADFLTDPVFLEKRLKMKPDEIRIFLQDRHARRLIRYRRELLDAGMDYVLYVNPDADLDLRFASTYRAAMLVPPARDLASPWPGDIALVTRPVSMESRVVGASIGRELYRKMEVELGDERFGSGKAAAWLIERCFRDGEDLPLEERIARAVDSGYEFEKFTDWLTQAGVPEPD